MTIAKGVYTRHYFTDNQTDFETAKIHAGSDAVKLKTALVFVKNQNAQVRDDYHPETRDFAEDVPLDIDCSISGTAYVLGAGTQGNAPDLDSALGTAFTKSIKSGTTVASSPSPTTTSFKLNADNLDAGDIGKIDVTDGSGKVIEKRYFYVESKDGSDVLTVTPALANSPQSGDTVRPVVNYNLGMANPNAITCHRSDNLSGEMGVGCKFHKFTWRFAQGQAGELNLEGQCHDVVRSVHTAIDESGGIDSTSTQFNIETAAIETGAIVSCEGELMEVTGVSGAQVTVARGYNSTTPASHSDDTAIGPYEPDETTAGAPIRGLHGGVWIGGEFVKAEEATVSVDEKTAYVKYFGSSGKAKLADNPENREVTWSLVCYMDATVLAKMRAITANTAVGVFMQAGRENGRACAFYSPKVQFAVPEIPDSAGELVKITLESRAVLTDSGEDSVVFGY